MGDSPHPTAVEFISKWDYHNASREQAKVLEDQVRDFPRGAHWEPEDLIAAFSHLRDVGCTRDFPVYDTAPAALTNAALDWLLKHTEDNETYYDAYLAFIVAAVAAGPKLFQIEMMNKITSRRMRECLKNISGDRLVNFLRGLKKQFENNETMPKEYCSKLSSVLRTRVLQEFTKDQINLYPGPFLELFMFYQSQVPSADEHYGQLYYTNLVNALEHIMGREKWKELEASVPDPAPLMISEQIKAITNVVKSGKFPAYEKQPDLFKSCLRNLLQIIRANKSYFPLYLDDVMQSFCVFAKLTCDAEVHEKLLDPHSSFFNRLSEDCKTLVENKPDLFVKYAPMLTNLLLDMKNPAPLARIIKNVIEYFLTPTSGGNPGHVKLWIKFLAAMVTQPDTRYIETVERFMKNQKKLLKWKDNVDGARLILANIGATKYLPKWEGKGRRDETDPERVGRAMGSVADELLKQAKSVRFLLS